MGSQHSRTGQLVPASSSLCDRYQSSREAKFLSIFPMFHTGQFIPANSLPPDRCEASISDWFTLFISGLLLLLRSICSSSGHHFSSFSTVLCSISSVCLRSRVLLIAVEDSDLLKLRDCRLPLVTISDEIREALFSASGSHLACFSSVQEQRKRRLAQPSPELDAEPSGSASDEDDPEGGSGPDIRPGS